MPVINLSKQSSDQEIANFESQFKKGKWLIRYHADWCGHCQTMKKDWTHFEKSNHHLNLASIEEQALERFKTQPNNLLGFPSIHLNQNGQFVSEFEGARNSQQWSKFYHSHQGGGAGKKSAKKKMTRIAKTSQKKLPKKNKLLRKKETGGGIVINISEKGSRRI